MPNPNCRKCRGKSKILPCVCIFNCGAAKCKGK